LPAPNAKRSLLVPRKNTVDAFGALVGLRRTAGFYTRLNWWTRHRAVRTEDTATSWKRLQCLSAALTVVEGHAGVGWHGFGRLVSTMWARESRLKLWLRHAAKCGMGRSGFHPPTRSREYQKMAERVGFEPTVRITAQRLSSSKILMVHRATL
jgi:hypothetical protein